MPMESPLAAHWTLDPAIDFLNHGSFGACPRVVLEAQQELRAEMERRPVEFLARRFWDLLDAARQEVAAFLGADAAGLVVVPNTTTGVSTVLRSVEAELRASDELLTTDQSYDSCRNALDFVAARSGARLVIVEIPFPLRGAAEVTQRLLDAVTPRTRLALVDHITSPTALVLPVEEIVRELTARGVEVLVDGAHAPGMLPLRLVELGAAWYTGNCHKWICAPKGAAILWAREDKRASLRPLVVSHGYENLLRPDRSRLHDEFDWQGTDDPTAFLCVPEAIRTVGSLVPGGWPEVRRRNHALALAARDRLVAALGIEPPAPDDMLGSMAAVPLPDGEREPGLELDPLQRELLGRHSIEVPVMSWRRPRRVLRVSAQLYNEIAQYERLAAALGALVGLPAARH